MLRVADLIETGGRAGLKPIDEAKGVGTDLTRCSQLDPLTEVGGDEHVNRNSSMMNSLNCLVSG